MNKYLTKIAAKGGLKPHQQAALDLLKESGGIVLHHSMGAGKSRVMLQAVQDSHQENDQNEALIIAPASLQSNVDKEIKKHGLKIDNKRLTVMSYEGALNHAEELRKRKFHTVIFDEAQRLRNTDTLRNKYLRQVTEHAHKRILATGTGVYNAPSDIAPLVNIAAGYKVLPEDRKAFEKEFIATTKEEPGLISRVLTGAVPTERKDLTNKKLLKHVFSQYIHAYDSSKDPSMAKHFPSISEKIVKVPMSKDQLKVYNYLENDIPWHIRIKIHHGLPLSKKESANLNAFSQGVRQASNSVKPYMKDSSSAENTPKIKTAVDNLEAKLRSDKNFKGLVYSNYLGAGVGDYSQELTKRKIQHNVYTGSLSKLEKDRYVKEYNEGGKPVLVISSSGGEGLDLKGTKLVQVLEPHFNSSKINQVKGRAARFGSHEHLPEAERKVEVEHYMSTFPDHWLYGKTKKRGIDEYLFHHSGVKDDLAEQMKSVMEAGTKEQQRVRKS